MVKHKLSRCESLSLNPKNFNLSRQTAHVCHLNAPMVRWEAETETGESLNVVDQGARQKQLTLAANNKETFPQPRWKETSKLRLACDLHIGSIPCA